MPQSATGDACSLHGSPCDPNGERPRHCASKLLLKRESAGKLDAKEGRLFDRHGMMCRVRGLTDPTRKRMNTGAVALSGPPLCCGRADSLSVDDSAVHRAQFPTLHVDALATGEKARGLIGGRRWQRTMVPSLRTAPLRSPAQIDVCTLPFSEVGCAPGVGTPAGGRGGGPKPGGGGP
jgi:hypothetical protein